MKKTISLILILVLFLVVEVVKADFTFGEPQDLGLGSGNYSIVSADELELYFTSNRAGGLGNRDLWVSTRQSVDDPWGPPTNLQTVNSSYQDGFPCISRDGLTLYFSDWFYGPDRPGGLGGHDLWFSTRASRNDPWGEPVNMGAPFNSSSMDVSPTLSHDGLIFTFASTRPRVSGNYDLWMCTRPSVQEAWGPPVNMGQPLNSGSHDYCANLSPDGLALFFESRRSGNYRTWMTMRRTVNDPWERPLPLPEPMYSMGVGCVSADGSMFYAGIMSQVPILPVVDFNGDGIVDSADMCIMVDHWGEDYPLCDIGPMPWGDGIVDVQDLIVLSEYLFGDMQCVAHFKLDEAKGSIANDSARNRDGTIHGGPEWHPAGGIVGGALQLDGFDDYVKTGFVLNPADGALSVFVWVKGGAPGQAVLSQIGGAGWLCADSLEGNLMTGLKAPSRVAGPLMSQTIITDGDWRRIGLVWDGSNRTLYVDDVAAAEDTQDSLEGLNSGLYLGCGKAMEPGTFFSGLIDDVRIYNRAVTP
ncbi:MAG: LamG-like jellyroll fold domain-containing protein [Planctomycetota bacterium]|jgi:hypothetical protein